MADVELDGVRDDQCVNIISEHLGMPGKAAPNRGPH
jgi:hypothetical protein